MMLQIKTRLTLPAFPSDEERTIRARPLRIPLPIVLALTLSTVALCACALTATPTRALTPVTVQLQWTHQAEFAGFYAADQEGYYAAEGLSVTFIQGGADVDHRAAVQSGAAQFGTATGDEVILARTEGKTLRAIATIFRRSPVVFFSKSNLGIRRPQDFVGKSIRAPSTVLIPLRAMTARVGISPDQYTVVNLPSDVALFVTGSVPVWGAYVNGMVPALQQAGYTLNFIYPDDYGVHFYSDSVITTDSLIAAQPDLVRRFLRATLKGWTFAVENPATSGVLTSKYNPGTDAPLETARMTISLPLVNTGEDFIGWMKPEIWAGMEKTLREQGMLTKPVDVAQVYTMQFVQEIYGK
jgi:NitT/TauT family transport system substrate-binding protein